MSLTEEFRFKIRKLEECNDPGEIMASLGDICFDAECYYDSGDRELARAIFSEIWRLDQYSDYYAHARSIARGFLIKLGEIKLPSVDEVIASIVDTYGSLSEKEQYILLAKKLSGEYGEIEGAHRKASEYLELAEEISPLSKIELKLKAKLAIK